MLYKKITEIIILYYDYSDCVLPFKLYRDLNEATEIFKCHVKGYQFASLILRHKDTLRHLL